jgi:hypothetical protein
MTFQYGPSIGFIDALRYGSYLVAARFTVYQGGRPQGTPYYSNLSVGSFTVDRNSEFRRTGEITLEVIPTIPPPLLMPCTPQSLISPFGTELFIETGVAAIAGVSGSDSPDFQWVPSGLFAIATSTVDDTGMDCTITLNLYDRSWAIAQRVLKNPWNFPATSTGNFVQEIQLLLNTVWNEQQDVAPLQFNIVPTGATVPQASYDQGADPWQACMDMANSIGYELFFDVNGIVVGRPIPNPLTTPVTWNFSDDVTYVQGLGGTSSTALFGDAYSTPVEVSVAMTRDGIYNDIVIQGTGTANAAQYNGAGLETSPQPLLAEASDSNPLSPTYIGGPMGDVPNFIQSSLVTVDGAQPMANNDLAQTLSTAWKVTVGAPPNPIFDVSDVVTVTRPRVGLTNAVVVLDTITHVFNYADIMYLTGRILSNTAPVQSG